VPQVPTSSCGGRERRPSRRMRHENAATTSSRSRDEFRPSFASFIPSENGGCREGRVAAAPGAPAQKKLARARKPQVQADTLRPSPRSGLRLIRALPGEPAFATVVGAMRKHRRQLKRLHRRARTTRLRRPRRCRTSPASSRPPHSAPRSSRPRYAPCVGAERGELITDSKKTK
jgi:hypothetical protein